MAHIVFDKDTNAIIDEAQLNYQMGLVNMAFAPIGVSFKICEFRYIYNFRYDSLNMEVYENQEMYTKYLLENRINMFFLTEITGLSIGVCGFAENTVISSFNSAMVIKCPTAQVIAHELGHYFGLPHTFAAGVTTDELADGSNCASAGDGFCDTPADPYVAGEDLNDYINNDCLFINSSKKDSKGHYYDPDVSNVMSYYPEKCICLKFTWQQYESMANHYLTNPFVW